MADGTLHRMEGLLVLLDGHWAAVHVLMDDRVARRGAGEGGTYAATTETIEFTHLWHVSAGLDVEGVPRDDLARLVRNEAAAARRERCRYHVDAEALSIAFPSGNRLRLSRTSAVPAHGRFTIR